MSREPDPEKLQQRALDLAAMLRGASLTSTVSLGVRLGLYYEMRDAGPLTSEELAARSGLHERWLREWLRGQAAAGLVEYQGDGRFELPIESAAILADSRSLHSMEAVFEGRPDLMALTPRVEEAFRTGLGFHLDARGKAQVTTLDGLFGNWHRQVLVQGALPAFDGVVDRLKEGAVAADVGCGSGVALLEMAKTFPKSTFHGYDNSKLMLGAAAENLAESGVDNARFFDVSEQALPDAARYDFVLTFDCLHDMTNPDQVAAAVRSAMKPDGVWFIADMDSEPTFEDNLRDNPRASVMYALSLFGCLASSMSEPGSVGYGTLGLPEPEMRKLVEGAGFTGFRRLRPDVSGFAVPGFMPALYEAKP